MPNTRLYGYAPRAGQQPITAPNAPDANPYADYRAELARTPRKGFAGVVDRARGISDTPYADLLGSIQEQQEQFYQTSYRPLANQLIKDVDSTAIVDAAKESANEDRFTIDQSRAARQRQRLGVSATASQAAMADYNSRLGNTLTNVGNINKSRMEQQQRNTAVRDELINISRGIATDAMGGALDAANMEANRNSTNANLAAQNKAAQRQTNTAIASTAMMALMMMM